MAPSMTFEPTTATDPINSRVAEPETGELQDPFQAVDESESNLGTPRSNHRERNARVRAQKLGQLQEPLRRPGSLLYSFAHTLEGEGINGSLLSADLPCKPWRLRQTAWCSNLCSLQAKRMSVCSWRVRGNLATRRIKGT